MFVHPVYHQQHENHDTMGNTSTSKITFLWVSVASYAKIHAIAKMPEFINTFKF